jgi:hypothetical protein
MLQIVQTIITHKKFSFQIATKYPAGIITSSDGTGKILDSKVIKKIIAL